MERLASLRVGARRLPEEGDREQNQREGSLDLGSRRSRKPGDFQLHCCQEKVSQVPLAHISILSVPGPPRWTPPHSPVSGGALPGQPWGCGGQSKGEERMTSCDQHLEREEGTEGSGRPPRAARRPDHPSQAWACLSGGHTAGSLTGS